MGATHTLQQRLAWIDTDAQGIWHYATAIRMAEAVETDMYRTLGISEHMHGRLPRVRVEFEFHAPVVFDQAVDVTLRIERLGTSSMSQHYTFVSADGPVADGRIVVVRIDPATGRSAPWPAAVRGVLEG